MPAKRIILGSIMTAALVGLIVLDQQLGEIRIDEGVTLPAGLPLLLLGVVMISLASLEMRAICHANGLETRSGIITAGGLAIIALAYLEPRFGPLLGAMPASPTMPGALGVVLVLVFLIALIAHSVPKKRTDGAVAAAGGTLLAVLYLGVLPAYYVAIRHQHGAYVVAAVIIITKCGDIGAYTVGSMIGKHKLIPWLSPGKTWEGLAGGVSFSALAALGLAALNNALLPEGVSAMNLGFAVAIGACFGALGHIGDLIASLFKRDAGLKDSGHIIPGFGGIIDVVDSPLFVAPLAYWLLQ